LAEAGIAEVARLSAKAGAKADISFINFLVVSVCPDLRIECRDWTKVCTDSKGPLLDFEVNLEILKK